MPDIRAAHNVMIILLIALASIGCSVSGESEPSEQAASAEGSLGIVDLVAKASMIDLTHSFDETTIYWPTAGGFELIRGTAGYTDGGYYYEAHSFAAAEHGGTHLDAPIHFYEGADATDEVPLARLVGEGVVIDLRGPCLDNPDYQITIEDLSSWEVENGKELSGKLVLLHTGWSDSWPDRERYLGTAELGAQAVPKLHFPGLHPEAARWLTTERSVRAVGIDTASIDYGQSTGFESHVALFSANIPVFENVANLDTLPAAGFVLVALPMKIGGGSGGPLRIVALVPDVAGIG